MKSFKCVGMSFTCCAVMAVVSPAAGQTPEQLAAQAAARATEQEADAEAEHPPPELMLEVWRVPLARPYAIDDADMIRLGLEQEVRAPSERSARKRAAALRARAALADGDARGRAVALRLAHAAVDQLQAERSHRVHLSHLKLAEQALQLSRSRHSAGGSLADVSSAELETARAAALVAGDEARAASSRLLVAALGTAAGAPQSGERPELSMLRLLRDAELAEAEAEAARAGWPDLRVGASYFAPTSGMAEHGFGVSLGMKLPWLWGSQAGKQAVARGRARAMQQELRAKQRDLAADVVQARGVLRVARGTLGVLRERVLPAAKRARDLAAAAYESGQARLEELLRSEAMLVETEMQIVELEGELAHSDVELAFAEGRELSAPTMEKTDVR